MTTPAGVFTAETAGPNDAPLVLLLHGYPQSRHTWRHQVPALGASGFRALAVDQRGYSPGARPDPAVPANYHVDRLVEDVLAIADATGSTVPRRFHVVGHDWGGAVAWLVADRHPERLASLAVLSRPHPAAFSAAVRADADGQRHRSRHHRAFHDPETANLLLENGESRLRRMLAGNGVPPDAVEDYVGVLGHLPAMEAALTWYRAVGTLAEMTAGPITVPTLYVWGNDDHSVGRAAAEGTGRYVVGPYRFVEMTGVGHFATDEAPALVTDTLLAHLPR